MTIASSVMGKNVTPGGRDGKKEIMLLWELNPDEHKF